MATLIPALLFVVLLVPSSHLQRFDELPPSAPPESAALVLLVPLYYPRHLIAAYVAMGLAALYAAGRGPSR